MTSLPATEDARRSAHLVDPALVLGLGNFPPLSLSPDVLPMVRAGLQEALAAQPPGVDLPVDVTDQWAPGPEGAPPVRLRVYQPRDAVRPMPALLHVHGGGYVLGTPEMQAAEHRQLAVELGCTIVSVDYRLAPETPFPGPLEDCYAGLAWLVHRADALGVDRARIGVGGESAGGGLAAALALLARDRGDLPLAFQHLISPMLDDRTCVAAEPHPFTGEYVWTPVENRFGWTALLGRPPGGQEVSPYAAAARATDLAGLPPAYLAVGALDLFLDEDLAYAQRLTRAGVPVELHVYPGAYHGYQVAAPEAPVTQASERDSRAALRRLMGLG